MHSAPGLFGELASLNGDMNIQTGFLFAGQGSQYLGMGKDLYETYPDARTVFDSADKRLGFSLSNLCFGGPKEELTKTNNAQPAILTMTIACWEVFKRISGYRLSFDDYACGLSLGEYSALVASEALTFEDAVYLVRRRGEFMEEEALKRPGKMACVLGLNLDQVKDTALKSNTEVANINSPGQIVLSGSPENIDKAKKIAEDLGARGVVILDVSGAFHSSFMKGAADKLAGELDKIKINKPRLTVVANVTAAVVSEPQQIKELLVKQVYSSVLWEDSIRLVLSTGVSNFIEFGPGKVLKGLMRKINDKASVSNVEKKEDIIRPAS